MRLFMPLLFAGTLYIVYTVTGQSDSVGEQSSLLRPQSISLLAKKAEQQLWKSAISVDMRIRKPLFNKLFSKTADK
jgi:hypothetical protein